MIVENESAMISNFECSMLCCGCRGCVRAGAAGFRALLAHVRGGVGQRGPPFRQRLRKIEFRSHYAISVCVGRAKF